MGGAGLPMAQALDAALVEIQLLEYFALLLTSTLASREGQMAGTAMAFDQRGCLIAFSL